MADVLNDVNQMFGEFGIVDYMSRMPYCPIRVKARILAEYALTVELMASGNPYSAELAKTLKTPADVRKRMYDMAEQIIALAGQHYKIIAAPIVEIRGEMYWPRWPDKSEIMTTGHVTIEFMEKDE